MFKTKFLLPILIAATALSSQAAEVASQEKAISAITDNQNLDVAVRSLQGQWAIIKYRTSNKKDQSEQIAQLAGKADDITKQYPTYAEPKIWQAIILSTQAGIDGGLGALGLVKQAKALLEEAEKINPSALDGSIYTSLGSLYYKVPAWPIGFGDDKKAKEYLQKAVSINPQGIDANYFYGDYLLESGDYSNAVKYLEIAKKAAPRPGRDIADAGRQEEIELDLKKAYKKLQN